MRKIRHSFNMVEIVLAIGVVAFGITGVMALLPPALNANRDVVNDSFVDEGISKMQAAFSAYILPQWDTYIASSSSTFIKTISSADSINKNLHTQRYSLDEFKKNGTKFPDKNNPNVSSLFNIYNIDNVYCLVSADESTAIHATIWKENIPNIDSSAAQRIYIEFSWPVTAAYETRKNTNCTRIVTFDVFKGI